MNNTGLFACNTIPIQYYTPSIEIQYNNNTNAILTKFLFDPKKHLLFRYIFSFIFLKFIHFVCLALPNIALYRQVLLSMGSHKKKV